MEKVKITFTLLSPLLKNDVLTDSFLAFNRGVFLIELRTCSHKAKLKGSTWTYPSFFQVSGTLAENILESSFVTASLLSSTSLKLLERLFSLRERISSSFWRTYSKPSSDSYLASSTVMAAAEWYSSLSKPIRLCAD